MTPANNCYLQVATALPLQTTRLCQLQPMMLESAQRIARSVASDSRQRGRMMAGLQGYAFVLRFVKIRRILP